MPAEQPRAGLAMEQPQHVLGHGVERHAIGKPRRDIVEIGIHRLSHIARGFAEKPRIHIGEKLRVLIGGAAHHHAIDMLQMRLGLIERGDAAIDDDGQFRPRALQRIDERIIERRHVAIFFRRESHKPGLACVHGECRRSGARA